MTSYLSTRPSKAPDFEGEARALSRLALQMGEAPHEVLQDLVDAVVDLCGAGSAGISIVEGDSFRWLATSGSFKVFQNSTLPRNFSPCGVVLDTSAPQLMSRPSKVFPYIDDLTPTVEEVALVPFRRGGEVVGTLWAASHDDGQKFSSEDFRLLQSLSAFAGVGYHMIEERSRAEGMLERVQRFDSELRLSRAKLLLALDSGEMGSWNLDGVSFSLQTDERARAIFGGDIEGKTLLDILPRVHAEDLIGVRAAVEQLKGKSEGVAYAADFRVLQEDGHLRWVSVKGRANLDDEGQASSIDGTIADITERKAVEERLRDVAVELSDADRRKDHFLAMLAHELRNPLAPIRNSASLIKLGRDQPEVLDEAASVIERQLTHMVRLVDDLLDVSRVRTGKVELRKARLSLAKILDDAVERVRPLMSELGHSFTYEFPNVPVHLFVDGARISQVVSNLLTNAAKYSERGSHVRLTVSAGGGKVRISVKDTGIGIAESMLSKVFELFSQVDQTLERTGGGLGIGLSLVRSLVDLHDGTVEVRSEGIGHGSEFIVTLPAETGTSDITPEELLPAKRVVRRKIFVVDDNRDSALSLAMVLKLQGHEPAVAHDGRTAVSLAEGFRPDVMLIDIGLPGLNGYEVARAIRETAWGGRPTLVALTGWGREEDERASAAAGFDAHLVKPLSLPALNRILAGLPS